MGRCEETLVDTTECACAVGALSTLSWTPGPVLPQLEAVDPAAAGLRSVGATSEKKKANVYLPINSIIFSASSFELWAWV